MNISLDMEMALANSYKNFHARGLDYICLSRTPELTQKLYILDGDASKVPEVVNPHDHRYRFNTKVLAGRMIDHRWMIAPDNWARGEVYHAFDYLTPLNGGNGFTYRGEEKLVRTEKNELEVGEELRTEATHVHTIQMAADQTVLLLEQFADIYPTDQPTSTWSKDEPSIADPGLYERFTEGQLIARLQSAGFKFKEAA